MDEGLVTIYLQIILEATQIAISIFFILQFFRVMDTLGTIVKYLHLIGYKLATDEDKVEYGEVLTSVNVDSQNTDSSGNINSTITINSNNKEDATSSDSDLTS